MYKNKKILITGGTGMMAYHLVPKLLEKGSSIRLVTHQRPLADELKLENVETVNGDLTSKSFVNEIMDDVDHVFHLAAYTGGLGRMSGHPASTLTPNLQMDSNVFEAAHAHQIERFMYASCSCIYPNMDVNLSEDMAWAGDPPEVHASYSWAKRMGEYQAKSYHDEYGMKIAIVRPSNSYGENDNFDPVASHVIPALIIKAAGEKMNPFKIWGDGTPIREFIYAGDVVDGMMMAFENYCVADPLNLASGEFTTIGELAKTIIELSDYEPDVEFDVSKPNGQMRRVLASDSAKTKIGFSAQTSLHDGLKQTIDWYKNHKDNYS